MNKKLIAVFIGLIILLSATIVWADHIDREISRQQHSIDRGIQSGKLVPRESHILNDNLNHIRGRVSYLRSNGMYHDRHERAKIDRMLDRNSRMIQRMKHNNFRAERVY